MMEAIQGQESLVKPVEMQDVGFPDPGMLVDPFAPLVQGKIEPLVSMGGLVDVGQSLAPFSCLVQLLTKPTGVNGLDEWFIGRPASNHHSGIHPGSPEKIDVSEGRCCGTA